MTTSAATQAYQRQCSASADIDRWKIIQFASPLQESGCAGEGAGAGVMMVHHHRLAPLNSSLLSQADSATYHCPGVLVDVFRANQSFAEELNCDALTGEAPPVRAFPQLAAAGDLIISLTRFRSRLSGGSTCGSSTSATYCRRIIVDSPASGLACTTKACVAGDLQGLLSLVRDGVQRKDETTWWAINGRAPTARGALGCHHRTFFPCVT